MKQITNIILAILLLALASFATETAGAKAPLGFKWGQEIDLSECVDFEDVGMYLIDCKMYTVPKPVQNLDFVHLLLYKGNLVKITVFMDNIEDDPYGTKGTKAYENMKSILSKKYGEPTSSAEIIGKELYQESSEFYQCLMYSGCGMFFSYWGEDDGSQVAVQLAGLGRSRGFIKLLYESKAFKEAVAELKQYTNQEASENL